MNPPTVSILIPTFNRPQLLSRAIESASAQTFQDWELLIVHDGPCVETKAVGEAWQARDRRIRYMYRPERTGIAKAMNFGLEQARGEYIAILDDDDIWVDPDKLSAQVTHLDGNPEHIACGGGAIVINGSSVETMRHLKPEQDEAIRRSFLVANPMINSSMAYRRQDALRIGGYDPQLDGFHDWDLWLRLAREGQFYNFQRYFICYTVSDGCGSAQSSRANAMSAWRIVLRHRKHYSRFPLALAMALAYRSYAALPAQVQQHTFAALSQAKKKIFAAPPQDQMARASAIAFREAAGSPKETRWFAQRPGGW
jgi:glycosyltransferase involved in cell wall biosynthesis